MSDIVHPSFKDVCLERGLLADDSEWNRRLQKHQHRHLQDNSVICFARYYCFSKLQTQKSCSKIDGRTLRMISYIAWDWI